MNLTDWKIRSTDETEFSKETMGSSLPLWQERRVLSVKSWNNSAKGCPWVNLNYLIWVKSPLFVSTLSNSDHWSCTYWIPVPFPCCEEAFNNSSSSIGDPSYWNNILGRKYWVVVIRHLTIQNNHCWCGYTINFPISLPSTPNTITFVLISCI
jgi:hypothetical protein